MTKKQKANIGLGYSLCSHCGSEIEDELHVFRDCPLGRHLWAGLVKHTARCNFFGGDLGYWICFKLIEKVDVVDGVEWPSVWATTCHAL